MVQKGLNPYSRRTAGGDEFGGRNSGHPGGRYEARTRRTEYSSRTERAGVGCGRSSEAKAAIPVLHSVDLVHLFKYRSTICPQVPTDYPALRL